MSSKPAPENHALYAMRTLEKTKYIRIECDKSGIEKPEQNILERDNQDPKYSNESVRFESEALLGIGTYGEVWRVQDKFVQRKVAIKKLNENNGPARENCQREAVIGARVSHPGSPSIYDIGVDDKGKFRVIMEYIEGETLSKIIKRLQTGDSKTHQDFPFLTRAELLVQLLRVLVAAQKKGIVHCDIKPDNILIGPSKELFLCDWGIAFEPRKDERKHILGTPAFMAPEQVDNTNIDFHTDVFSVAAVAYKLMSLSSWHPYTNDLGQYLISKSFHTPLRVDRIKHYYQGYVPSEYRAWIHKGLNQNPESRFTNAEEMLAELVDIQNGLFCVICPRTLIKSYIFRYTRLLDKEPDLTISATLLLMALTFGVLIIFGSLF